MDSSLTLAAFGAVDYTSYSGEITYNVVMYTASTMMTEHVDFVLKVTQDTFVVVIRPDMSPYLKNFW